MIKKYNIAFVPKKNPRQFIDYAIALAKDVSFATYLLGEQCVPHISVCHFLAEENSIENIWQQVSALNISPMKLIFDTQRSKSYPGHPKWGGVSWVSLISDHLDILKAIHLKIAVIIKEPLNASFSDYDPHLTLFNSFNQTECFVFNKNFRLKEPLIDNFTIALGPIDNNGQLLSIVKI